MGERIRKKKRSKQVHTLLRVMERLHMTAHELRTPKPSCGSLTLTSSMGHALESHELNGMSFTLRTPILFQLGVPLVSRGTVLKFPMCGCCSVPQMGTSAEIWFAASGACVEAPRAAPGAKPIAVGSARNISAMRLHASRKE